MASLKVLIFDGSSRPNILRIGAQPVVNLRIYRQPRLHRNITTIITSAIFASCEKSMPQLMKRKIRYGMIGGGTGGFIGAIHRMAAAMDQQIELVCGAFSSDPARSRETGERLFLPPSRCYPTFQEMLGAEAALP